MRGLLCGLGHMGRIHASKLTARGIPFDVLDPPRGHTPPVGLRPDFAIIASPTTTHVAVARPLLDAGVPCLIEKPLAPSAAEAAALAAYPHLSVGHVERFNPTLTPLRGTHPRFLEAARLAPFQQRGTDVDVIADLMIHDLDLALWLLGGTVTDIRALGVGVMTGVADIVNVRLELDGGRAVATLSASRVSPRAVRTLRLVEAGTYWSADLQARTLHRVAWGERDLTPHPVPVPEGDAIDREQQAFLAAVRGEAPFPCPGTEALAALLLADQIRSQLDAQSGSRHQGSS